MGNRHYIIATLGVNFDTTVSYSEHLLKGKHAWVWGTVYDTLPTSGTTMAG